MLQSELVAGGAEVVSDWAEAGAAGGAADAVSSTVPGVTAPHHGTSEALGNLLPPEPAVRTGALGTPGVSTSGQLLDRRHALAEAGGHRVFADKLSGKLIV